MKEELKRELKIGSIAFLIAMILALAMFGAHHMFFLEHYVVVDEVKEDHLVTWTVDMSDQTATTTWVAGCSPSLEPNPDWPYDGKSFGTVNINCWSKPLAH